MGGPEEATAGKVGGGGAVGKLQRNKDKFVSKAD